jgi:hypothetical protein
MLLQTIRRKNQGMMLKHHRFIEKKITVNPDPEGVAPANKLLIPF